MSRPKCCRQIGAMPGRTCFKPEGETPLSCEVVLLNLDEYEALRLADLKGLYQEQAASRMNISRQTFGRIIKSAHRKIVDAIVNGKILNIEGGHVSMEAETPVRCPHCRLAFRPDYDKRNKTSCPHCGGHP